MLNLYLLALNCSWGHHPNCISKSIPTPPLIMSCVSLFVRDTWRGLQQWRKKSNKFSEANLLLLFYSSFLTGKSHHHTQSVLPVWTCSGRTAPWIHSDCQHGALFHDRLGLGYRVEAEWPCCFHFAIYHTNLRGTILCF